jgi:Concanavalin A-like lectin/glucanases superfamily
MSPPVSWREGRDTENVKSEPGVKILVQKKAVPALGPSAKTSWITTLVLAGGLVAACPVRGQSVIAHWSFDTPTLSYDGSGNIIGAADSTGNHDAVLGSGNNQKNATSDPFASSASVSGQFGQALTFDGANYLSFPDLTELMAPSTPTSFSMSCWINTTATSGFNGYQTFSDWGSASGDHGTEWSFGPESGTEVKIQTRYGASSSDNIISENATLLNGATLNDGNWHMLTFVYDINTGDATLYFDAVNQGIFAPSQTTDLQMFAPPAGNDGNFGLKGDSPSYIPAGTKLDEAWVFDGALNQNQVNDLYTANNINAVPEPSSTALAVLGLCVLMGLRPIRRYV